MDVLTWSPETIQSVLIGFVTSPPVSRGRNSHRQLSYARNQVATLIAGFKVTPRTPEPHPAMHMHPSGALHHLFAVTSIAIAVFGATGATAGTAQPSMKEARVCTRPA